MQKRRLGKTQLMVTPFCFGGGAISGEGKGYGFGPITEKDSIALLQLAVELGINFFDTAPIYGFGTSEIRMGKAFKNCREKVILVSKAGVDWHESNRVNMTNDPVIVEKMLNESLERLQTDYIDIYLIHWPDEKVDIRKSLEPLVRAQREGKIRHLGLSNFMPEEIKKAQSAAEIAVLQNEFNLFKQNLAKDLFPFVEVNDLGFMSYGTLAKGVLSGRVIPDRKFDSLDARSWAPWWKNSYLQNKIPLMPEVLEKYTTSLVSPLDLAVQYNLSFTTLSACICGARNEEQLRSLLLAFDKKISHEILTSYSQEKVFTLS